MKVDKIVNHPLLQARKIFLYSVTAAGIVCASCAVAAIASGSYPAEFIKFLVTALLIVGYCGNCLVCLKSHSRLAAKSWYAKMPLDWLGVFLCTVTMGLLIVWLWTDYAWGFRTAMPALSLSTAFTIAITQTGAEGKKLITKLALSANRVFAPILGVFLAIIFAFAISDPTTLKLMWCMVLVEIALLLIILTTYSGAGRHSIVMISTDSEGIFRDRKGNLYEVKPIECENADEEDGGEASQEI